MSSRPAEEPPLEILTLAFEVVRASRAGDQTARAVALTRLPDHGPVALYLAACIWADVANGYARAPEGRQASLVVTDEVANPVNPDEQCEHVRAITWAMRFMTASLNDDGPIRYALFLAAFEAEDDDAFRALIQLAATSGHPIPAAG